MAQKKALIVQHLKKYYQHGKVKAVDDISFDISQGERFGFLGPNGAGKTTTLRSILGLLQLNGGEISIFGKKITPNKDINYRNDIGYIPGELGIYKEKNATQFLHYMSALYDGEIDWKYVAEIAERLQLEMNRPIGQLSKGNRQKVGILAALMRDFPILILDEPTSGLDPIMQAEFYQILKERQEHSNCTIFLSSHLLYEVQKFCERVAIIRKGKIVEISSIKKLITKNLKRIYVELASDLASDELQNLLQTKFPTVIIEKAIGRELMLLVTEQDKLPLIRALSTQNFGGEPIQDINIKESSLEHIFMQYYSDEKTENSRKSSMQEVSS